MWDNKIEDRGGSVPRKAVRGQCTVLGGGCTERGGEAAVHRFITQQPTLFLSEWGVMRGDKRGNKRGEMQRERREAMREERERACDDDVARLEDSSC